MNTVFVATTAEDLRKVTWLLHDCFFELNRIQWDERRRLFELPFGRGGERKGSFGFTKTTLPCRYDCTLAVSDVHALDVIDEARIGGYDLLEVRYDALESAVVVESCIPLKIVLTVRELEIRVQTHGEPHSGEGGLSWYTEVLDVAAALQDDEWSSGRADQCIFAPVGARRDRGRPTGRVDSAGLSRRRGLGRTTRRACPGSLFCWIHERRAGWR